MASELVLGNLAKYALLHKHSTLCVSSQAPASLAEQTSRLALQLLRALKAFAMCACRGSPKAHIRFDERRRLDP